MDKYNLNRLFLYISFFLKKIVIFSKQQFWFYLFFRVFEFFEFYLNFLIEK
jgi:hypothetical protein